jgi:sugar phosphate isomerase/epimerase
MVTINGATDRPGWSNYIKTLDEGDYDVGGVLRTLRAVGYQGPVGLQCYNLKGALEENLEKSMKAWKEYCTRMSGR